MIPTAPGVQIRPTEPQTEPTQPEPRPRLSHAPQGQPERSVGMETGHAYPSALIADSEAERLAQELARQQREADEFRRLRDAEQREFEQREAEKKFAAEERERLQREAEERERYEREAHERGLVKGAREAAHAERSAYMTAQMRAEEKAKRKRGVVNMITTLIVCGALIMGALFVLDLAQSKQERAHAEITEQVTEPTAQVTIRIVPDQERAQP